MQKANLRWESLTLTFMKDSRVVAVLMNLPALGLQLSAAFCLRSCRGTVLGRV